MVGSQFDNENAYPVDPLVRCHIEPISPKYLLIPRLPPAVYLFP
jgi:hypothetical protein